MTIAEIIAAARQYTQITGAAWYTPTDELRSFNRGYRDVYEKILDADDEFFIKEVTVLSSTFTQVREHTFDYTLPLDWHRLRNIVAVLPTGNHQFGRFDPQDITATEGYRYFQDKLRLFYGANYDEFRIEYYPKPTEYTVTSTDIVYPSQLEPLILAYQMAMDITKSQKGDPTPHAEEYLRLWNRFAHAIKRRDNLRYTKVANKYRSTFPGW
jgi:hypothetical protein